MFSKRYISAGVEIGTNSIKVILAEQTEDESLAFIGGSEVVYPDGALDKVVRGEIRDVQVVTDLLRQALTEAEKQAGAQITNCHFCVTGAHFGSKVHSKSRPSSKTVQLTEDDIESLVVELSNFSMSEEWSIVHNSSRRCLINNSIESRQLIGQSCYNYSQENLVVYGNAQKIEDSVSCLTNVMGVEPDTTAFSGLASAMAVINDEDKKRGGTLSIDIGEGVTEYALFHNGKCFYAGQLPIGCRQAANDLSIGLKLPFSRCQQLLKDSGRAVLHHDSRDTCIEILGKNGQPHQIKRHHIENILNLRFKEIFELIKRDLKAQGVLKRLGNRICLSGGGALITDIDRLASEVFKNVPVDIGRVSNVTISNEFDNPRFITAAGIVIMAMQNSENWGPSGMLQQIKFDLRDLLGGVKEIFVNLKNAVKF